MRQVFRLVLVVGFLALAPAAFAQGTIAGIVKDASGAVLPGVTVEASSPALIEKTRSVVTDGTGQYKIVDLRPGAYTVTFVLPGFSTVKRDGIELSGSFVASVNAELKVGAVEETITVSGEAPTVDVQGVTSQRALTKETLDAIPTGRLPNSLAVLIPGTTTNTQDVGGRDFGYIAPAITVHGSKSGDYRFTVDGLSPAGGEGTGQFTAYMPNMSSSQEVTIDTSASNADQGQSGLKMNLVPREGGNTFKGTFFGAWANSSLEGNNYSQDLKTRGLPNINTLDKTYDVNPGAGGAIVKDKLWFFSAARWDKTLSHLGSALPYNLNFGNPNAWLYAPDPNLNREAPIVGNYFHSFNTRLTLQATPKNKFSAFYDDQTRCSCPFMQTTANAPDAVIPDYGFPLDRFATLSWSSPVTSRLLLEAGIANHAESWHNVYTTDLNMSLIPVTEQSTGMVYRNYNFSPLYSYYLQNLYSVRAGLSYVTGAHALKVGFTDSMMDNDRYLQHDTAGLSYRFNNGVPNQITEYATPYNAASKVRADVGLYAQDRWTVQHLTLNLGLRYDYFNLYFPDQHVGAGPLVPTRDLSFPQQDAINWKDITPRVGAAWDVFGNGRTAIKATANKYVSGAAAQSTSGANPVNRLATSTTRTWTDANKNFIPDCNLTNTAANGECGAMANAAFGLPTPSTTFDPATLNGWNSRGYNWEFSASVQHQVVQRISAEVGLFRRIYSNQTVTDNLSVAATDYGTFSVTAPSDSRLPNGGGNVISGLYDLNPNKLGQVNNLSTFARNYGNYIDHWQGVDFTVNARPSRGVLLQGGISTGRTLTDTCAIVAQLPETGTLTAPYCRQDSGYITQLKLLGTYTVPKVDVQISGTFQSIPGPALSANANFSSAVIQPSLGRALSAGATSNATVNLIAPLTVYGDRLNQLDLRFGKILKFGRTRTVVSADLFNAMNANPVLSENSNFAAWRTPLTILTPRFARLSVQFDF